VNHQSPFVVDMLQPRTMTGQQHKAYQLTPQSVTPTRIIGSDELGMPIEERIPIAYSRKFVGLDGCTKDVPLRSAAVFSNDEDALRYERATVSDIIRSGQLPLDECPYTNAYRYIKGGPLVKSKDGTDDCGGKPGGCEHMQAVIKARQAVAKAKWDKEQEQLRQMKPEDAERLAATIAEGVGRAIAANDPKSNRRNLAQGKGEAD
jgi:sRNA-binding protein